MAQGIITITKEALPQVPATLQEWHTTLLLPDTYCVVKARPAQLGYDYLEVLVESEAIPASDERLTEVVPIYRKELMSGTGDYQPLLDRIEMRIWSGGQPCALDEVA